MNTMNGLTRLSTVLDASPAALDYIIALNPHDFERLRNPLMRKVMPPRITLQRLAAMLEIPEPKFLEKLSRISGLPLNVTDKAQKAAGADTSPPLVVPLSTQERPFWLRYAEPSTIKWVDLGPIDERLEDPMPPINIAVNTSKEGEIVGIKHKWEPQPLFDIWSARGLEFFTEQINEGLWQIYVYKPTKTQF